MANIRNKIRVSPQNLWTLKRKYETESYAYKFGIDEMGKFLGR